MALTRCIQMHTPSPCSWGGGGGGGRGGLASPGFWRTHPTPPHQKMLPPENNAIYQRGPNLEVDVRYRNLFLAPDALCDM